MSARQFRGKLCVYRRDRLATTADHIFSRQFFLVKDRGHLPQAPACQKCNGDKSHLESYLTAVLPFGGRHQGARENLIELVPKRLAKNLRLHRDLQAGRGAVWRMEDGALRATTTVPVDSAKTTALFSLVARALSWYHWCQYLRLDHDSEALQLTAFGAAFFSRIFAMNAAHRVERDLGNGTISYRGVQAVDNPQLTLWRIQFYGGLVFSNDPEAPTEESREIGAITGPKRLVGMLAGRARNET